VIRRTVHGRAVLFAGIRNSAAGLGLGFYVARPYSLMRPPRTSRQDDTCAFLGEVGTGCRAGRVKLAAMMGSSSGVVVLMHTTPADHPGGGTSEERGQAPDPRPGAGVTASCSHANVRTRTGVHGLCGPRDPHPTNAEHRGDVTYRG
jgi:hypothetical protein